MENIKIQNLTFTYPNSEVPALNDVSLSVNTGEFVCICGKSGCGKTSLLRQLKPLIAPSGNRSGQIIIDGVEISKLTQKKQAQDIGFVFQNPDETIVCDKVWHELAFGLESLGIEKNEIRARVAEMASFFGIQDWYYKNVNELSGGQKQLLNLASVMVMQPSILVLDEPTSQLDPISARGFLDTVSKINREFGMTVILSEHRLEDALPICDRVVVMDKGKIIADGEAGSVGNTLKEMKSDMFLAIPTPMRVYYSLENGGESPVTVRDGREWLSKIDVNNIKFEETKEQNTDVAVQIKDVWFRYEKNLPDVLKGTSLEVKKGELYAIVGGNGTGKTTLLSVVSGINTPYRGKIKVKEGEKISSLSQNPKSLFAHKTVFADLKEMLGKNHSDKKVYDIADLCGITEFLHSHPYDLSGGEQQRAALAKVLLSEPDILLLDEPTKGLDAHFKNRFAKILQSLKDSGVTIIMVSHDIEFCAKYADRVAMFFDGGIVSENSPRAFFSGKSFYTTAANRMSRSVLKNAILAEDIILAIGGSEYETHELSIPPVLKKAEQKDEPTKKYNKMNILWSIIFAAMFCFVQRLCNFEDYSIKSYIIQIVSIVFLGIAIFFILPKRKWKAPKLQAEKPNYKNAVFSAIIIFFLVPFTIYAGIRFFGDRKYYFISMLIILEIILPFIFGFEFRKPKARELVLIAVLCAIGVAGRIAFAFLPQFKPVIALVIISGACFGGESGFLVGCITAFASNFYFTQGPWTPWQMFAFGLIGFLAGVIFKCGIVRKSKLNLSIFGFISAVVIYGGIMNPASVIMWQGTITLPMIWSSIALGFPLDLIHGVATVFFLWLGAEPMIEKLERVKIKYGIFKQ